VLAIHLLNPLIVLERILGLFFNSLLPPRNLAWQGSSRDVTYPHTDFSWTELAGLLKRSGFELKTAATYYFAPGAHLLWCRLNPELTEEQYARQVFWFENLLRHIPILRKLGTHWWIEARR
jgi:hypothetical protein